MTMQKTLLHPDAIGNGSYAAPFTKRIDIAAATDADSPNCLYISWNPEIFPGNTPAIQPGAGSVTVDGDGAGTQARITLTVENKTSAGVANSDITFTIDCDGAKTDWSSGAAVAYSLKDIIDLINDDNAGGTSGKFLQGFHCWIGEGGMYDLVCGGAAMFQDLAETYIMPGGCTGGYTGFLKRDLGDIVGGAASDGDHFAIWRLGLPESRDRGLFKILDLYGTVSADTGDDVSDNAGIMVVRDDYMDYVTPVDTWATDIQNHEFVYHVGRDNFPNSAGVATYNFIHKPDEAPVVRGPVVVIVKHDTDYDTNVLHIIAQLQAVAV